MRKQTNTQRQVDEARIRQSRFRRGIKGLRDRFNGRHDLTKQENRLDAQISAERDAKEREELIRHHPWERRQLRKERDQTRQKIRLKIDRKKYNEPKHIHEKRNFQSKTIDKGQDHSL